MQKQTTFNQPLRLNRPLSFYSTKVVGSSFRHFDFNDLGQAKLASDGRTPYISEPCQLIAEPSNPYDKNAVGVWVNNIQIGYLPKNSLLRDMVLLIKPDLSNYVHVVGTNLHAINPHYNNSYVVKFNEGGATNA